MGWSSLVGLVALAALVLSGCFDMLSDGGQSSTEERTLMLWIDAQQDAYVTCGRTPGVCEEGDWNLGTRGDLVVSFNEHGRKVSYVQFPLPTLPDGAVVEHTHVELFHAGTREDGSSDEVRLQVARANGPWSYQTLTWNNQPNPFPAGGLVDLVLRSNAWSASENLVGVYDLFDEPWADFGLVISYGAPYAPIEKGFGAKDPGDFLDDRVSPRLLVRIRMPAGTSVDDLVWPSPGADEREGSFFLAWQYGTDWPAGWAVAQPTHL